MDRMPPSHDQRSQDVAYAADTSTKGVEDGSATAEQSVKKNTPSNSTATANSAPTLSTEGNDRNLSSIRSSPKSTSDDDTGTLGGPVHHTLPGNSSSIRSGYPIPLSCFYSLVCDPISVYRIDQ